MIHNVSWSFNYKQLQRRHAESNANSSGVQYQLIVKNLNERENEKYKYIRRNEEDVYTGM